MKINWKVRLRNKAFWISTAAFVAMIGKQFGIFDVPDDYMSLVNTGLSIAVAMGVIIDPTTPGLSDGGNE